MVVRGCPDSEAGGCGRIPPFKRVSMGNGNLSTRELFLKEFRESEESVDRLSFGEDAVAPFDEGLQ
jgi:hypothetical protein